MSEPTIEKIRVTKAEKEELNQILNDKTISTQVKLLKTRRTYEGLCHGCQKIPDFNVKWDLDGIILVERYCKPCFKKYRDKFNRSM